MSVKQNIHGTPIGAIVHQIPSKNMARSTLRSTPISSLSKTMPREGYAYVDSRNPAVWRPPAIEQVATNDRNPVEILPSGAPSPVVPVSMIETPYVATIESPETRLMRRIEENQVGGNCTPITDQLLPETSTMVYTDEFFQQPEARLFLNNIQPNIYSYNVDLTPINSNIGITYTPQRPPMFRDQVYNLPENATYPLYSRIDPQLIRDDGVPARLQEQPPRMEWSAKYSSFNPPAGSINFEDVYDPRFTSYGDGTRAYSDINQGNVQYYASDLDSYRYPNFITRSNVDFIEYTDPMGTVKPYYQRTAGLNDARPFVANQWMSDTSYFRENLMADQMSRVNRESWQQRFSPLSRASHPHSLKYGY